MMDPNVGSNVGYGFFRSLVENSPEVIIRFDRGLRRAYANPAIERIMGMPPEKVIGLSVRETDWPSELISLFEKSLKDVFNSRQERLIEYEIPTPEGLKYRQARLSPELDSDGSVKTVLAITSDITRRRQAELALKASEEQLRKLYANMEALREQEKAAIARDIHDNLGQKLLALKMDLAWLKSKLSYDQTGLINKTDEDLKLIDDLIVSVKRINEELRPSLLDHLGLEAAIEWLIEGFEKKAGISCVLEFDAKGAYLGKGIDLSVFRILQEALNNIFHHARATEARIRFAVRDGVTELEISDNGIGITKDQLSKEDSFGIQGIRERIRVLKGEIKIEGLRDGGTSIKISIPPDA